VGAASTKVAVTVGGNVPLTYGKETESISALWNVWKVKKKYFFQFWLKLLSADRIMID
jgi:hypothetical protein